MIFFPSTYHQGTVKKRIGYAQSVTRLATNPKSLYNAYYHNSFHDFHFRSQIEKELENKPYLTPLVGLEFADKKEARFNPFSSFTDFSNFNTFKETEDPKAKYGYLLNQKAYPVGYKDG